MNPYVFYFFYPTSYRRKNWGRVGQDREGQLFERLRKRYGTRKNNQLKILEKLTYCRHGVRAGEKEGCIIVSSGAAVNSASQLSQATTTIIRKSVRTMEVRWFFCSLDHRRLINNTHHIVFSQNQRLLKEDLKQLSVPHCLRVYIFSSVFPFIVLSPRSKLLNMYVCMYVCMYVWSSHIAEYGSTG